MSRTVIDTRGRLVAFDAAPPSTEEPLEAPAAPPWEKLFEAAGLDLSRFQSAAPPWNPPVHSDARAAWTGSSAEWPELNVRVEAASYRGRPVYFRLVFPWTRAERSGVSLMTSGQRLASFIYFFLFVAILGVTSFFAYRNIAAGQGDQRGGLRLALVVLALDLASWALLTHGTSNPISQILYVLRAIGSSLLIAVITFAFYMALEPDVRKRSPELIMGWTRLIWGRFRDPRVGRDILIGIAAGSATTLVVWSLLPVLKALGVPPGAVAFMNPNVLIGLAPMTAAILVTVQQAPAIAMGVTVVFLLLERLLRSRSRAIAALVVLLAVPNALQQGTTLWAGLILAITIVIFPIMALVRGGMLAFASFMVVASLVVNNPLTSNYSHWTAPPTFLVGGALLALSVFALRSVGLPGTAAR